MRLLTKPKVVRIQIKLYLKYMLKFRTQKNKKGSQWWKSSRKRRSRAQGYAPGGGMGKTGELELPRRKDSNTEKVREVDNTVEAWESHTETCCLMVNQNYVYVSI